MEGAGGSWRPRTGLSLLEMDLIIPADRPFVQANKKEDEGERVCLKLQECLRPTAARHFSFRRCIHLNSAQLNHRLGWREVHVLIGHDLAYFCLLCLDLIYLLW